MRARGGDPRAHPLLGQVALAERRDGTGGLDLQWREQGGPSAVSDAPVTDTYDFSQTLIESAIQPRLCGSVEMRRRPKTTEVRIRVAAEELSRS